MEVIIEEVQQAKYLSISVDSTPDITHTDQLSITIRYVFIIPLLFLHMRCFKRVY